MPETLAEVLDDLRAFLNDGLATSAYARMGLMREREFLEGLPTIEENPDPTVHLGVTDPSEVFAPCSRWRRSEALRHQADGGPVEQRIGQQWIVSMFTAWEHEYRRRLEAAHGLEPGTL